MLDKIMGAFTFRKGVYSSVANDPSFTSNAWLIVVVVQVLAAFGSRAALLQEGFFRWLIGAIVFAVIGVIGFAVSAFLVPLVANALFKTNTTFDQMQRSLGLAHVWRVFGLIGILAAISVALVCILSPIGIIAGILGLVGYLFAIKETTGMDWVGTIVTVVVTLIIDLIVTAIGGGILAAIGLGAAALLH